MLSRTSVSLRATCGSRLLFPAAAAILSSTTVSGGGVGGVRGSIRRCIIINSSSSSGTIAKGNDNSTTASARAGGGGAFFMATAHASTSTPPPQPTSPSPSSPLMTMLATLKKPLTDSPHSPLRAFKYDDLSSDPFLRDGTATSRFFRYYRTQLPFPARMFGIFLLGFTLGCVIEVFACKTHLYESVMTKKDERRHEFDEFVVGFRQNVDRWQREDMRKQGEQQK